MRTTLFKKIFIFMLVLLAYITNISYTMAAVAPKLITFIVSPDESVIYSINQDDQQAMIMVNDAVTGALIKTIPVALVPTHQYKPQLAITPDGKQLYIVDVNKLTYVLDLSTYQVTKLKNKPKQDVGFEYASPVSMMPDGKHLYIAEGIGQLRQPPLIHIVDTQSNRVDIAASGTSHFDNGWFNGIAAYSKSAALLYLSRQVDYYHNEISILDTRTHHLQDKALSIPAHMSGMAVHPVDDTLYVLENGTVVIINPATKHVINQFSIDWANHTFGMAFGLNGNKLYVLDDANMGTIHIIDTVTHKVINMKAALQAFYADSSEIKSSFDGSKIYVSTTNGTILTIDASTDTVTREIDVRG